MRVENRLERLEKKIDTRFDSLILDLSNIMHNFEEKLLSIVDGHERRLDRLEDEVLQ